MFFVNNPRNAHADGRIDRSLTKSSGQTHDRRNDIISAGLGGGDGLGRGNHSAAGVSEHPLDGGAADIDPDGELLVRVVHLRITERVR